MTFVRTGIHSIVRFARRAGIAALAAMLLMQTAPVPGHSLPAIAAAESDKTRSSGGVEEAPAGDRSIADKQAPRASIPTQAPEQPTAGEAGIPSFPRLADAADYVWKSAEAGAEVIRLYVGDASADDEHVQIALALTGQYYVTVSADGSSGLLEITCVDYPGTRILRALRANDLSVLTGDERRAAQLAVEIVENARAEAPDALALERALHDWLCENVDYTNGEMTVPDVPRFCGALGALLDGEANCQGYSDAFYLLAGLAGFEVRHQNGTDASGAAHTWNVIRLNGKWYIVDVTHDDVESSNTWHYKAFNAGLDLIDHTWPEEGSIAEIEAATDPSLDEYLANGRAFDSLSALAEAAILARQNGGTRIYRAMLQGQTADWEALSDQILEAANARGISCSWQIYASAQAGNTYYSVEWTEWE